MEGCVPVDRFWAFTQFASILPQGASSTNAACPGDRLHRLSAITCVETFDVMQIIHDSAFGRGMFDAKVLLLSLNYLGIVTASLGMLIFIPQIIQSLGTFSNMAGGWLTMIPYIFGGIGLVVWGRISDRMNERRWNLLAACVALHPRACHCWDDHGHLVGPGRHV
ncbi:MAG: hypothetical protein QOF90_242, partial [Acetobacteraceae bacterium]|nr:hypothetical protein [Acetobacteraceae bacterium]